MNVICRYAEIGLKGDNRPFFEKQLVKNIDLALQKKGNNQYTIKRTRGRILVSIEGDVSCLQNIFGLASYSTCHGTAQTFEELTGLVREFLPRLQGKKFRVTCQRLDKQFPLTSQEIAQQLGSYVQSKTSATVDLESFNYELGVEVIEGKLYFYTQRTECAGGLPTGCEGTVLALIEGSQSILAGLLAMKRGCRVVPISFAPKNTDILEAHSPKKEQLHIIENIEQADQLAHETGAQALVTGDTLEAIKDLKIKIPILRPLVGMSKEEAYARINAFGQSVHSSISTTN